MKTMVLVLLATLTLWTGDTWAQKSKRAQARSLAQSGVNAYDLGEFGRALSLFEKAYETYPDPDILYNIAQSHRKLGHHERAVETYKAYLRNKPDAPDRGEVAEQIDELNNVIESQQRAREKPPEGARAPITAEPEPATQTAPALIADAPPRARWYSDYVGWSLVGAGAAVVAVGAGLHVSASSLQSDLAQTAESERDGVRDRVGQRRTFGTIGLVTGGALIAAGIIKFALWPPSTERRATSVSIGPGFAGVAGTF